MTCISILISSQSIYSISYTGYYRPTEELSSKTFALKLKFIRWKLIFPGIPTFSLLQYLIMMCFVCWKQKLFIDIVSVCYSVKLLFLLSLIKQHTGLNKFIK